MRRSLSSTVGHRIRQLRAQTERGRLTQERLAERADISVSFLSMIERGERSAHVETLSKIALALDVPLEQLFLDRPASVEPPDPLVRPLAEFIERKRLTRADVERLLVVAHALFG